MPHGADGIAPNEWSFPDSCVSKGDYSFVDWLGNLVYLPRCGFFCPNLPLSWGTPAHPELQQTRLDATGRHGVQVYCPLPCLEITLHFQVHRVRRQLDAAARLGVPFGTQRPLVYEYPCSPRFRHLPQTSPDVDAHICALGTAQKEIFLPIKRGVFTKTSY